MTTDALFPARTESAEATQDVGQAFADTLQPGDVVALVGELGTGKTQFVRGVVEGLGGAESDVSSPTFTIAHEYAARVPVVHMDLYRLKDENDVRDAGLEDYLTSDAVCLVEWPERAGRLLPPHTVAIRLSHTGGDGRLVERVAP